MCEVTTYRKWKWLQKAVLNKLEITESRICDNAFVTAVHVARKSPAIWSAQPLVMFSHRCIMLGIEPCEMTFVRLQFDCSQVPNSTRCFVRKAVLRMWCRGLLLGLTVGEVEAHEAVVRLQQSCVDSEIGG